MSRNDLTIPDDDDPLAGDTGEPRFRLIPFIGALALVAFSVLAALVIEAALISKYIITSIWSVLVVGKVRKF